MKNYYVSTFQQLCLPPVPMTKNSEFEVEQINNKMKQNGVLGKDDTNCEMLFCVSIC